MNPTSLANVKQRRADLERSLHLCIRDGWVAMPLVTMSLPVNVFITTMVTKGWVLPKPAVGLLCAMPFAGNFVQIFAVPFLSRFGPPKNVSIVTAGLNLISWFALAIALEWVPRDEPQTAAICFISWYFVSSIFQALAGVTWNEWIQDWVPARLRGTYFGRRNRHLQVSVLLFLLATGWVLAHWEYAVGAFQSVIVVAGVMRAFSLYWQWIAPTRPLSRTKPPVLPLAEQLRVLRGSHSLLWFIAFGAVWFFAANCFGPFYHTFLFEQMNLSAWDVGVLSTVSAIGGALALPAWGKLLDRFGNRPVMAVSLLSWQLVNVLWCFLTPDTQPMVYLIWALGGMTSLGAVASAGFVLGQFTILLRLVPVQAKSLAIGVNLAVTSLAAALAPVVGGLILDAALKTGRDPISVYHACFALQPVLATLGCLLLLRVKEPSASSLTMVFGAMRNIRTLSAVLGLEFLVNYVFYRSPKAQPKRPGADDR